MDGKESMKVWECRENEGASKWEITHSKFKLIISLHYTLTLVALNKERIELKSKIGYRNTTNQEFRAPKFD